MAYVVIDGLLMVPVLLEQRYVPMPKVGRPSQLCWLRNELLEIIGRWDVDAVAYKGPEGNAQSKDLGRAEAEGVLQEAVQSLDIEPVRRLKSQLKADLGFDGSARYIENALVNFPNLADLPHNRREAALAALSALLNA